MDGKQVQPKPVGFSGGGDGFPQERVQRHQMQISQAATLRDLSGEYAWFSLALMYSRVRLLGRDPWGDYVRESGHDDTFQVTVRFDKPIFKGMAIGGDEDWNHVLWAMPQDRWEDYCKWMGQLSFIDRDLQLVTRLRTQNIDIADPLFFDRAVVLPAVCPTVPVTVFVLDTNQGCTYLQPGPHPFMDLPAVVYDKTILADTKLWADAALGDHQNPFGYVEQHLDFDPTQELAERVKQAREADDAD